MLSIHSEFSCVALDAWTQKPSDGLRPVKRNSAMKYFSQSLRLNNNNITNIQDLHNTVSYFLAEPSQLAWLDLSFNSITHIDHVSLPCVFSTLSF